MLGRQNGARSPDARKLAFGHPETQGGRFRRPGYRGALSLSI